MFNIPRSPAGLVAYAFRALAKDQVPLQRLVNFLSFDIRQLPPSQARKLVEKLQSDGQVIIEGDMVKLAIGITVEPEEAQQSEITNLGERLKLFVSSARLSRAVGIDDKAIELVRVSEDPLKVEATVHGSQEYMLNLDEANRRIAHNCPDWRRVSVLHRFCKHVAKLFLLLSHEEALRILQSIQDETWEFEQL